MARTVTAQSKTNDELADEFTDRAHYMDKRTRDAVYRILLARGKKVLRGSSRGTQLHPEFVSDFVGTYETGFGNTDYQRSWDVLYSIRIDPNSDESHEAGMADDEATAREVIKAGSRVMFIGPCYPAEVGGPKLGAIGTVTERGGYHAQRVGGPRQELVTVHFDGEPKAHVVAVDRVDFPHNRIEQA